MSDACADCAGLKREVEWLLRVNEEAGADARYWSAQWRTRTEEIRNLATRLYEAEFREARVRRDLEQAVDNALDLVKTALAAQCDHSYTGCVHDRIRQAVEAHHKEKK